MPDGPKVDNGQFTICPLEHVASVRAVMGDSNYVDSADSLEKTRSPSWLKSTLTAQLLLKR